MLLIIIYVIVFLIINAKCVITIY